MICLEQKRFHAGRVSRVQTSRLGITPLALALDDKDLPADVRPSLGRGLATSLARTSNVAVSAWMRVSPKPTIVSGRRAITRTDTGSPPAGV